LTVIPIFFKGGQGAILFGLETKINFSRRDTALPCPYRSIFRKVIESAILNRTVLGQGGANTVQTSSKMICCPNCFLAFV